MRLSSLSHTPFSQITDCFNEAFRDYFVHLQATADYLQDRWQAAGVDYNLSVGAFEKEKLVGFMILCTGETRGIPTVHNAGTGVVPACRGRRLVAEMYAYALPKLIASGSQQSTLEVITLNEKAIRAYEAVGYKIVRKVHCFSGSVASSAAPAGNWEIKTSSAIHWPLLATLPPHRATWEQRPEVIAKHAERYECWQLWAEGSLKASLILNPATGKIEFFSAKKGDEERYGLPLLYAVGKKLPVLRVNNVAEEEDGWRRVFEAAGLTHTIDQYEMKWIW